MKKVYAIDFDGTICENKYPKIGKLNEDAVKFIAKIKENGDKWILNTIREKDTLKAALDFLKENGIEPDAVNENLPENVEKIGYDSRKILADVNIDDTNAGGLKFPQEVKNAAAECKLALTAESTENIKGEFSGVAYSGGLVNQPWIDEPIVIDLQGVSYAAEIPLMYNHVYDPQFRLGVAQLTNDGKALTVKGICDAENEKADSVRKEGKKHDFQLSVGTDVITEAETVENPEVNGRKFEGKIFVIKKCEIREVSVCALGADKNTSMKITAKAEEPKKQLELEIKNNNQNQPNAKGVKTMAEEITKLADLEKEVSELKAKLEAMPKLEAVKAKTDSAVDESKVQRAALLRNCGISEKKLLAKFGERVLEAAAKNKTASIQKLIVEFAHKNGYNGYSVNSGNLREVMQAAFSTADVTNVITATANDVLLNAADGVDQSWREIAHIIPATNYQAINRVRLNADILYEEVKRGGEIKHGALTDEGKTIQVKPYARLLEITMQDIVDDSLGAFADLTSAFAAAGLETLNTEFWKEFETTNFFTGDSALSGSALSFDALATALKAFRKRKNAAGRIIADNPALLLVPSALEMTAEGLFRDTLIATSTASKTNTFNGKYKPVCCPYLTSDTAYYLLTDPRRRASMGVAFLNGVETPTIESTDADFNTLGIVMRGVFNFGVAQEDRRAGIKVSVN